MSIFTFIGALIVAFWIAVFFCVFLAVLTGMWILRYFFLFIFLIAVGIMLIL